MELAVYVLGDEFSILDKYPNPETSAYGIFMTFSYNVGILFKDKNEKVFKVI